MQLNKDAFPEACQHLLRDIEAYQDENARLLDQHIALEHQFNLLEQQLSELEAETQYGAQDNQALAQIGQYEQLFLQAPTALMLVDDRGEILEVNQWSVDMLEVDVGNLKSINFRKLLVPQSSVSFLRILQNFKTNPQHIQQHQLLTLKNEKLVDARFRVIDPETTHNIKVLISLNLIDIQVPSPHSFRLFSVMFEQSREGIIITDTNGTIVNVNHTFCEITGYSEKEVLGKNPRLLHSGYHSEDFYKQMWQQLFQAGWWAGEIWNRRKGGETYPEWLTINRVHDDQLGQSFYVANFSDLTERKKHQQQLDRLAFYDALTGLPNRSMLNNFIEEKLTSTRSSAHIAVFFLDLDKFKDVNDHYGHPEGDRVLRETSQRILSRIREGDMACRVGGDEFVVVLTRIQQSDDAITVAQDLLEVLSKPFKTKQNQHRLSASIGIAFSSEHGQTVSDLMRRADAAMYKAKNQGRNGFQVFRTEDELQLSEANAVLSHIWQAIDHPEHRIEMHYQPVFAKADRDRPRHFEALVRIKSSDGDLIYPGTFIELAEQQGLMDKLGIAIFEAVCRDIVEHSLSKDYRVAVNLSQQQFYNAGLLGLLASKASEFGLSLDHFQFEVTETATMENLHLMGDLLDGLKSRQAEILLDDFGTGYASLSILKSLPVNILKIDQSFVKDIGHSAEAETLITAIIAMAKALGLELVAEGVETLVQLEWLTQQNVDYMQGFYLAKPQKPFQFDVPPKEENLNGRAD